LAGIGQVSDMVQRKESLTAKLVHIASGFKFFFHHKLCLAGISLAMLYLTVLGFDGITISFCKASGVTESVLGILLGVSSAVGFLGSICFPVLRSRLGINCTALTGLTVLVLSDGLCLVAIFLPQSQFMQPQVEGEVAWDSDNISADNRDKDTVENSGNINSGNTDSLTAVYLLVAGVTIARFGLHLFDLCIIQLFQEGVMESKRGIFSGVASSLCNLMDMVKFGLVILLPSPKLHFGYLVLISFTSVFIGWVIFVVFTRQNYKIQRVDGRLEGGVGRQEGLEKINRRIAECKDVEEKQSLVATVVPLVDQTKCI